MTGESSAASLGLLGLLPLLLQEKGLFPRLLLGPGVPVGASRNSAQVSLSMVSHCLPNDIWCLPLSFKLMDPTELGLRSPPDTLYQATVAPAGLPTAHQNPAPPRAGWLCCRTLPPWDLRWVRGSGRCDRSWDTKQFPVSGTKVDQ